MSVQQSRFERLLADRRAVFVVIGCAMVFGLLSIAIGWLTDDYGFRAMIGSSNPHAPRAYDLFRFARGDEAEDQLLIRTGHLPWWSSSTFRLHFWRPITSLLMASDVRLFGNHALFVHLHSLVWYLALLVVVACFLRRVVSPAAATVALAVFALTPAHLQAYAWWSARHILVAAVPAVFALYLHVRSRQEAFPIGQWLAPVFLAIGLAGSEAALAAVPIWVLFELCGRDRTVKWGARVRGSITPVAVSIAYLTLYRVLGGGTSGGDGYHDPLSDPLSFAKVSALRVPVLLGDALLGIPAEIANVIPEWHIAIFGILAVIVTWLAWLSTRAPNDAASEDPGPRRIAWLVLGGLIATTIGATGFPSGRVLVVPNVAFSAVLGVILVRSLHAKWLGRAFAILLFVAHFVLGPLRLLHDIHKLHDRARATLGIAKAAAAMAPPSGKVTLVAASDPMVFFYPRGILALIAPHEVKCWSVLSAAQSNHRLTRTGERTFSLEAASGPLLGGSFDKLFRARAQPFTVGDSVVQCGTTIRVAAVADGLPTRLDVEFAESLDDPGLVLMTWNHGLERMSPPRVGESIEIPWSPGPTGL